ncbi:hypothetical protein ACIQGZ_17370 [Streptomyces sp. NPDC092296]|uniref:hypothetical protein n=1 Tax=Streptomyces sp. NPDC092296 TaxID=3366012 RepID=UPI0038261D0E
MIPGQYERGVQVRRRVTYGDWEPVRPDHWADERIETELRTTDPHPRRGDAFEAWLRARRDEYGAPTVEWQALDYALDAYRLHADTGTPLDRHCCEGGTPDDCEGCAGERQASGS